MNRKKITFIAVLYIFCFACEIKTDVDFSIIPVKDSSGYYQYIDISQDGKIIINPQFGRAHFFREGLALVKTSGKDGKWGYIDKNGNFAIAPVYRVAQSFSEGVAWVQVEGEPPVLIDKKGKMLMQIDSINTATYFRNSISLIYGISSRGEYFEKFIDKKGNIAAITMEGDSSFSVINEGLYAFRNEETKKWGFRNINGEKVINERFDGWGYLEPFIDGMAVAGIDGKLGVIDKKGDFVINPQYDYLSYDSDGLFIAGIGEKYSWINENNEMVINSQFNKVEKFFGNKLAPVRIGDKWGYIDKNGKLAIEPRFDRAEPFGGNYAMVMNSNKIGFINKKGYYAVPPLYDNDFETAWNYRYAIRQKCYGFTPSGMDIYTPFGNYAKREANEKIREEKTKERRMEIARNSLKEEKAEYRKYFDKKIPDWISKYEEQALESDDIFYISNFLREARKMDMPFYEEEIKDILIKFPVADFERSIVRVRLNDVSVAITPDGVLAKYERREQKPLEAKFDSGEWLNLIKALHKYRVIEWKHKEFKGHCCLDCSGDIVEIFFLDKKPFKFSFDHCGEPPNWKELKKLMHKMEARIKKGRKN